MTTLENPLLIFDLGNVIVRHDNAYRDAQLFAHCADPQQASAVLAAADKTRADIGGWTVQDFFATVREPMGFAGDYAAFEPLWCCHFSHDPAMEDFVGGLAAKYRVVILSNTDDAHWAYLTREYPVLQTVQARYTSFELKMQKPDAAIYRHVLEAEGRKAERAVFIDDKIENVEAARQIGIHGIYFTTREALEAELAGLGVG